METERSILPSPELLPTQAEHCQTLDQWLDLVRGLTQRQVADLAGVQQSRISAIVRGHLPRKTKWPALLKGFGLENKEGEFYRMILNAKRLRAMTKPTSETEPLFATARADQPATIMPIAAEPEQKAGLA